MLSRKIPKLKLWSRLGLKCKGSSNTRDSIGNTSSNSNMVVTSKTTSFYKAFSIRSRELGKYALQGIPVLSIFALVGIICCAIEINVLGNNTETASATGSSSSGASASLTIDNNTIEDIINAEYGTTNYTSHQVKIIASSIEDYKLTITGPATISTTNTDGDAISDATTLSAAGNKTPADMENNSWGYAWGAAGTSDVSTLTYQSFNGSAQSLAGESVNANTNSIDFTRTLAFAAKFAEDARDGHYKATVGLGLTVTPAKVIGIWSTGKDSGIETMQQMTPAICRQVAIPDADLTITPATLELRDARDEKVYTITRAADGNCWMINNLTLDLSVANIANAELSDGLLEDYPQVGLVNQFSSPEGPGWNDAPNKQLFSKAPQKIWDDSVYESSYGYYYSWCAATAGCNNDIFDAEQNITTSICPRGWVLPSRSDFNSLITSMPSRLESTASSKGRNIGSIYFPFSGIVSSAGLHIAGSSNPAGIYWSSTAYSTTAAYNLDSNLNSVSASRANTTHLGLPVRCVATPMEYTYSITYKNYVTGAEIPALAQTATSTTNSYDFALAKGSDDYTSNASGVCQKSFMYWQDVATNKLYYPGNVSTITVTADRPNITLISVGDGPCEDPF